MMYDETFAEEIADVSAMWCAASGDRSDLARVASRVVEYNMPIISAVPEDVGMLWTWLEKTPVRIYSRFYLAPNTASDVATVSGLAVRINTAFKHGADGAQIFLSAGDLDDFAAQIGSVRDDLFFNRDLIIGVNIEDVATDGWAHLFDVMARLRVAALVLVLARDDARQFDFAGRLYGALDAVDKIPCHLHFVLGARPNRMEQAVRLVRAMHPECAPNMRLFIPSE